MTRCPSYETAKLHKSDGINMCTSAAFQNRILAATIDLNAQKIQPASNELMEDEQKATKKVHVVGTSSWGTLNETVNVLADLVVVTKAKITKSSDCRSAKENRQYLA